MTEENSKVSAEIHTGFVTKTRAVVGDRVITSADSTIQLPRWYKVGAGMPLVRHGNEVLALIDGAEAFKKMVEAIMTAKGPEHFIYLIAWWVSDNFQLLPGHKLDLQTKSVVQITENEKIEPEAATTLGNLLKMASDQKVEIRAMFWNQKLPLTQNTDEWNHINNLENGSAILDDRTLGIAGTHHQKILVVKGEQGLIAFCGGVDINPNRIENPRDSNDAAAEIYPSDAPHWHDVHCRIKGPAVYDLLNTFIERWLDHPTSKTLDPNKKWLRAGYLPVAPPATPAPGNAYVQIGRTYPSGVGYSFLKDKGDKEQTARKMFMHAIRQAQKYIYIEDQYLVNMEASEELQERLATIQHLTILIPHASITDDLRGDQYIRRQNFIAPLKKTGGSKVRVFYLKGKNGLVSTTTKSTEHAYVHSKTWIIDDEFAIIGSANCNRRGWTHDSEVVAGITDASGNFARQLRMRLWAEHLGIQMGTPDYAKLEDINSSAELWLKPPPNANIEVYDENAGVSVTTQSIIAPWDIIDAFVEPEPFPIEVYDEHAVA